MSLGLKGLKSLEISARKYLITKRNSYADCRIVFDEKTIDGLDGTRITNITQKIRTFDGR